MYNRPEFISNWYGAINCGATPAFINNNLRQLSKFTWSYPSIRPKIFDQNRRPKTGLFSIGELTLLGE